MLEVFPIYSEKLKNERLIRVYTPPAYQHEQKSYPVLYMHDGQNVFNDEDAIGGSSLQLEKYLDSNDLEIIVVAIDQNSPERKDEYCPWPNNEYSRKLLADESLSFGGKGGLYSSFVVEELKPLIDYKYRTQKNRSAMAGISMGGQISLYIACKYPHVFKDLIILSSAFYANQEEMENLLESADLTGIDSFYMDCGTEEAGTGSFISTEFLASNKSIQEIVQRKIPHASFQVLEGNEHHYRFFQNRVPALFTFLNKEDKRKLKRKYGDRSGWNRLIKRDFKQMKIEDGSFAGDVTLLTMNQVSAPAIFNYPSSKVCVVADGYSWLQHFPENERFSLTTVFDDMDNIVQWYIDICLENGNENGRPWMDDLYLDIVVLPDGDIIHKDAEELEAALADGVITEEFYRIAWAEAKRITLLLEQDRFELIKKTKEHRLLLLEQ
ncbi:alpha/beta hydrolase-fold protein [Planomicrobium okeanokoites]|uniref:Alpha/beta hydrolase-fold protein n=1 Tax=Planomicrobium okeanokoites TaxID=244 RepID=A0ABV7KSV3_PLAOK|nr:alpha/beta hydrolase-fold protein [Planomicrobium okeanokoites]